ncbi:MAG: hypothetical protein QXR53_03930 [Candidatus Norongarragalinales archaeon]
MEKRDAGSVARVLLLGFAVFGLLPMLAFAEGEGSNSGFGSGFDPTSAGDRRPSLACPKTFNPVVCDGRKFWNSCIAKADGYDDSDCIRPSAVAPKRTVVRPDAAGRGPALVAQTYCTLEYAPVVCENGKTYANKCLAHTAGAKECERIVPSTASGGDSTGAFGGLTTAADSIVAVDAATGANVKAKWLAHVSAVKALHVKFEEKTAEVETEVEAEVKNKCKRPQISAEEYYKCLKGELKPNAAAYWIFSFAALTERAQKLSAYGVPQAEIDAFVSFVKEQSLAFDAATTVEEKRKIVNSVNDAWKEFRKKAYYWIIQNRIDNIAKKVENLLPKLKEIQSKLQANGVETASLDKVIVRLEENLKVMTSTDASVTLRQKWVAAHESVQLLKHITRLVNALLNGQPAADIIVPSAVVPVEVSAAEEVAAVVSADVATATPIASVEVESERG